MNAHSLASKKSIWVIVANEARATVFSQEKRRAPLCEINSLQNEKAQQKNLELTSDRDGRSFDSRGRGRHSMTNEKADPRQHAATVFAKEIADLIARAKHDGQYRDYTLVAAPRFLGLLRNALATTGIPEPTLSIDKDVVGQDAESIQELIAKTMQR